MKRSEINQYLRKSTAFFEKMGFQLPPWAFWSPLDWKNHADEANEISENALGWDLTDFGSGNFLDRGLLLFTIRNGNFSRRKDYPKPYAEKIMIVEEKQITPMHYHWNKMEDIINRGGGNLLIELHNADADDGLASSDVVVKMDGLTKKVSAGTVLTIHPGESITLTPKLYHKFWGEPGKGTVLVGEVSMVNDDANDNNFFEKCGRFPEIVEDEAALHLLCTEYPKAA